MLRRILAIGIVSLASIPPAMAEPLPAEGLRTLVRQLGHPRFALREAAQRALIAQGEPALGVLKASLATEDTETRRRVSLAIDQIEDVLQSQRLTASPKIKLAYRDVPLNDAVADLATKTGLPLKLMPEKVTNPQRRVTVESGELPLWEAVERFLVAAELGETDLTPAAPTPQEDIKRTGRRINRVRVRGATGSVDSVPNYWKDEPLQLGDANSEALTTTTSLFRVRLLPQAVPTGGSGAKTYTLELNPAPTIPLLGVVAIDLDRVVDDREQLLAQSRMSDTSATTQQNVMIQGGGQIIINGGAQVIIQNGQVMQFDDDGELVTASAFRSRKYPLTLLGAAESKSLKLMEGTITARIRTPKETILAIPGFADGKGRKESVDGYMVEVSDHRKLDNGAIRVTITLTTQANGGIFGLNLRGGQQAFLPAISTNSNSQEFPELAMLDSEGNPLSKAFQMRNSTSMNGLTTSIGYECVLQPHPDNDKAVLALRGARSVDVRIPFSVKKPTTKE